MLELRSFLERGDHVLLTVDGPRGPRRRAKPGAVELARMTGFGLVPVAFACNPKRTLGSWDHMVIPLPLARGVLWFGDELRFPKAAAKGVAKSDLDRFQNAIDAASLNAERILEFIGGV